ncbi:MAG: hypothetical protein ACRC78_00830 [Planktothrix sp.]
MVGYPFNYGDSLSDEDAYLNLKKYVAQYGVMIAIVLFKASVVSAVDRGITPPLGGDGKVATPSPTTPAGPAPAPGKAGLLPGQVAQPPVLRVNLPPSGALEGKPSLAVGAGALVWCSIMAAHTGNPALYLAAAALSIYFIS